MEISVRSCRDFKGPGPISLGALAQLERRSFPVSVREMATVEQVLRTAQLSAGDVLTIFVMLLFSNGSWAASADFSDSGTLGGDSFILDLAVDAANGIGTTLSGELGPGAQTHLVRIGLDPWIRENWSLVQTTPVAAHLHVAPDIGGIISGIAKQLLQGLEGFFSSIDGDSTASQSSDDPIGVDNTDDGGNGGDDGGDDG